MKIRYTTDELREKIIDKSIEIKLLDKESLEYGALEYGDKKALSHLVMAAKIVNDITLEQDHPQNLMAREFLEENASKDEQVALALKLFSSLNGVAGFDGVLPEPVEIFEDVKFLKGHNFYPQDLSVEEFHQILLKMLKKGKVKEVSEILSADTMVLRKGSELEAVSYSRFFAERFEDVAAELEMAAVCTTNAQLKSYLQAQAKAMLADDRKLGAEADRLWADMQDSVLEFTLSRENYDDEITATVYDNELLKNLLLQNNIEAVAKDMLGARVGVVNKEGTELILKFKEYMPKIATLMPRADEYEQKMGDDEFRQNMVDVDIVELQGDYAQCRGGITTAQNLPNNDKLSVKLGYGRRNVYHRQVRATADKERQQKILEALVAPHLHELCDKESDHLFVIGHENGHSLGPDSSFQNAVGQFRHIIEESKADLVSLAFMPEYVKAGVVSELELKKIYAGYITGRMFLVAKPHEMLPHRMAELMQFNALLEDGAIFFDAEEKLDIDFDKVQASFLQQLADVIEVQLSKSPKIAEEFVAKYAVWSDVSEKIAQIQQNIGVKPYKVIVRYF